jgi:5-methylcytosine-specific restriction endonuclease McrA
MEHFYFAHDGMSECEECIRYHAETSCHIPFEQHEKDHQWFNDNVVAGWLEMARIMETQEWKDQVWENLPHGNHREIYLQCKKHPKGPCQPCIKVNKAYNKEYADRPEVQARRKQYNRTDRSKNNKTRFKVLETTPKYSYYSANTVLAKYGTTCHLCNKEIDITAPRKSGTPGWENGLHIDHVVPLSKGGQDTLKNVRPSHGWCNLSKNNKA